MVPADDAVARATVELAQALGMEEIVLALDQTRHGRLLEEELAADAAEIGVETSEAAPGARVETAGGVAAVTPAEQGLLLGDGGGEEEAAVAPALVASELPAPRFAAEFRGRFDRPPGPYAAYGYEAMALALAAISSAAGADQDFRGEVVDAVLGAKRPDSVLGRYSITDEGDTTLCAVQPYRRRGGDLRPEAPLCPGG